MWQGTFRQHVAIHMTEDTVGKSISTINHRGGHSSSTFHQLIIIIIIIAIYFPYMFHIFSHICSTYFPYNTCVYIYIYNYIYTRRIYIYVIQIQTPSTISVPSADMPKGALWQRSSRRGWRRIRWHPPATDGTKRSEWWFYGELWWCSWWLMMIDGDAHDD